ncbi:MAG: ABC transporter substrate-binding protein [Syntrophomonadaceae bacterium]
MRSSKKVVALLIMAALVMTCLVGCQKSTPTAAPATAERTVTDMAGRTVKVPAEVKTIATFGAIGVLNAFVETVGEGSKICNEMSPSFTKRDLWKYQYVFAPQLKDGPVFEDASREIQMEKVLQVKPDLCLTMDKKATDLLAAQGLTVIYLACDKQDDVKTCVNILGEALNKKDAAADYTAWFDKSVAKASDLTEGIKPEDKKKVIYGSVNTLTQPHIIAEWWITAAGGVSVTNDGRTAQTLTYTMEDLLKWKPDVMILSDKAFRKDVVGDTRFASLPAIQDQQIFIVPTVAHIWGNRTPEQPLTVLWTINKLYPQLETTEALKQDISYFYSHFFKVNLTDEQLKEIIG